MLSNRPAADAHPPFAEIVHEAPPNLLTGRGLPQERESYSAIQAVKHPDHLDPPVIGHGLGGSRCEMHLPARRALK